MGNFVAASDPMVRRFVEANGRCLSSGGGDLFTAFENPNPFASQPPFPVRPPQMPASLGREPGSGPASIQVEINYTVLNAT
jgi:hypothetical protein